MTFVNGEATEKVDRQRIIIDYIRSNKFCNVQSIVRGVENDISRVTVYKLLRELIKSGAVKRHLENNQKRNTRDHKLFVDEDNPLVTARLELDEFEDAYFDLLHKAMTEFDLERILAAMKGVTVKLDPESRRRIEQLLNKADPHVRDKLKQELKEATDDLYKTGYWHGQLISLMLEIFYSMVDACLFRLLYIWSEKIQDKQVLQQLYSMIFSKIVGMQTRLSEILKSWPRPDANKKDMERFILERFRGSEGPGLILKYQDLFKGLDMEKEIEPVIDALWKTLGELQPIVYPEPRIYDWSFKYDRDGWKKLRYLLRQYSESSQSGNGQTLAKGRGYSKIKANRQNKEQRE